MIEEVGISSSQLRRYVVRPALLHLELHSVAAENLVVGTALTESRGRFIHQIGGPALGLWQMEPDTHRDIWSNYLLYRIELRERVRDLSTRLEQDFATELMGNLFYAAAMCRVHYLRVPAPLPAATDWQAMAEYYKEHYNTSAGAATVEKAGQFFRVACR